MGFIARHSGHSRGSTIDLTLTKDGIPVDMGTCFDFMGPESHTEWNGATAIQSAHRKSLADIMIRAGFRPYCNEWWHFTLNNEPYPETYFDFDIE